MEKMTLICVGKLKERYWEEAVSEYAKRLKAYCTLEIKEVSDEAAKADSSEAEERQVMEKEGERILKALRDDVYTIALERQGKEVDSLSFAERMEELFLTRGGAVQFVIGGSLGLSDRVLSRADLQLSFSKLTYPHQMMRVILLEQIYRSYRIRQNAPYHK